jgi:glycosyltransferase involved in cell wall biosynthesis
MPVFNEHRRVAEAIERTLTADLGATESELIVIDDGSVDGTRELLLDTEWPSNVRVLLHERNQGKGAAVRTGLRHASGEFTAIMDADLEYSPEEISTLLPPLIDGGTDAVFGTRAFESHASFNFWYVIGNKFVTLAANVMFNVYISDLMTCHKVLRTDTFRGLALRETGFAIEPEITARLLRQGGRIYEIPVTYRARTRQEGKKLTALDGLRVLRTLIRCRVDRV